MILKTKTMKLMLLEARMTENKIMKAKRMKAIVSKTRMMKAKMMKKMEMKAKMKTRMMKVSGRSAKLCKMFSMDMVKLCIAGITMNDVVFKEMLKCKNQEYLIFLVSC